MGRGLGMGNASIGSYLSEKWTGKPHVYLGPSSTERSKVEGSLDVTSGVVYYLYIFYINWQIIFTKVY